MSAAFSLARAGSWFLHSGIQNEQGGVARFYRAEVRENRAVSTEITGYTASILVYLFRRTADSEYLDRAKLTARFLKDVAWDAQQGIFPFELHSPLAYFFDSGIIIRGLLDVWRVTQDESLLHLASIAAHAMLRDFHFAHGEYHPVLTLPAKQPFERAQHWSKSASCYQTKSALAWWEVAAITGDDNLRSAYLECIDRALNSHERFLEDAGSRPAVMDRLHAYSYFLEALYPLLHRADCKHAHALAAQSISDNLQQIAPIFVRSDVYAQLLRARPGDEAGALAEFQAVSDDPRIDGGFYFGRRDGVIVPHVNPVSTVFAIQALDQNSCQMPPI